MFCSMVPMADDITEDEIFNYVDHGDEFFTTDVVEPSEPEANTERGE